MILCQVARAWWAGHRFVVLYRSLAASFSPSRPESGEERRVWPVSRSPGP